MQLTNRDVEWQATYDGYSPVLSLRAMTAFANGEASVPALLAALSDPDRFVLAHVLLTRLAGLEYAVFPSWNGLAIRMEADGRAEIEPEQREALAEHWRAWSASRMPAP